MGDEKAQQRWWWWWWWKRLKEREWAISQLGTDESSSLLPSPSFDSPPKNHITRNVGQKKKKALEREKPEREREREREREEL